MRQTCSTRLAPQRRTIPDRRGAAMIEFALVAPLFFLIVLGMCEFGQAMMVSSLLANAAHEGARAGVLNGAQTSDVTAAVNNYLTSAQISGATTTVSPSPPSSAPAGQNVSVTVSLNFSRVSWLPVPSFVGQKILSCTALMQRETGQ